MGYGEYTATVLLANAVVVFVDGAVAVYFRYSRQLSEPFSLIAVTVYGLFCHGGVNGGTDHAGNRKKTGVVKDKMLSYRRETALQGTLVLARSGRLELGDNILWTRSIFNHCDIIGQQSYRI